jgi:anti-sigma regulatory factor (Ser/Thr protein kinase)
MSQDSASVSLFQGDTTLDAVLPIEEANLGETVLTDQFHLRIPSRLDWIGPTVDYLAQRAVQCGAIPTERTSRVVLALHEALTNSIVHGNLELSSDLKEREDSFARAVADRCADSAFASRTVDVRSFYDGRSIRWTLTDQGPGFDAEGVQRRLAEEGPTERASGRGLLMMRAFLDEVHFDQGGRRVLLVLHRSGRENRASPRYPLERNVRVTPIEDDGTVRWEAGHEALLRNVSSGGLALLQHHLSTTSRLLVTIPTSNEPLALTAEIRHVRTLADNVVEVGCRFEMPADQEGNPIPADKDRSVAESFEAFLAGLQKRSDERRSSPRVPYTGTVLLEGAGTSSAPLRGYARNLSRGGISFLTTTPLVLEPTWLTLCHEDQRPCLRLRAQILRCARLMDGFYDVAARFVGC